MIETTDSNGNTTKFEYDSLYRNTAIVDALGNRTEYTYDSYSNVKSMTDPNGNIYHFEYDLAGNCTKTVYPDATSVTSEYDVRGRLISEIDQIGSKTTYTYDNANNLTSVTDPLNNITKYTYSSSGSLLSVTDANGNITSYTYDVLDRLVSTTLPTGGTINLSYDSEGNVTSSTDLNGVTTKYEYNSNGNLIKETTDTDTINYTYTKGLLTKVENSAGSIKYTYNNLNQITQKVLSDGTKIEYNYDINGNLIKVSTPFTSTSYEYDKLNRVVRVLDRSGNATLYEYDANGNRTAVKYANGITASYTYDSLNRLTKEKIVNANGDNVATYTYTLDQKGNRIKAVEDNATTQYEYDKLNRLTKETVTTADTSTVTTYTYDKVGNRLTKTTDGTKTKYTYNSYNQLLSETTSGVTTSYTYDANGNLLKQSDGTNTSIYTYNAYNRMISASVTKDGKTSKDTYTYDAEGNRLTKTTHGVLTRYIVDSNGLSQVLAELDKNNKVTAEYTHGTEAVSQNRSGVIHYYLFDGNGNIRKLTDSKGVVTDTYTYDAFGVTTSTTGVTTNPYRYCGEYQDETTSLYYLRARYYDTSTGRFTTADSYSGATSDPVSLHKYLYAHANPVMNSDPTGYFTLFEMSAVLNIQSKIQTASVSAAIGGLMGMMDALLGGERDPLNLLKSFASGAATGLVVGALFGGISALANLGCTAAKISVILKLALTGIGVIGGGISTIQSFSDGKIAQGIFRGINTGIGAYGLKKCFGSAVKTFKSCERGTTTSTKYSPLNPGPLKKEVANSFNGATYTERVLTENTVVYRVSGGNAGKVGSYVSRTPQGGGLQSQLDLALNPAWGNTTENITRAVVPKGTTIYEGVAAPQDIYDSLGNVIGTLPGGGNQIYIPKVEARWFE